MLVGVCVCSGTRGTGAGTQCSEGPKGGEAVC